MGVAPFAGSWSRPLKGLLLGTDSSCFLGPWSASESPGAGYRMPEPHSRMSSAQPRWAFCCPACPEALAWVLFTPDCELLKAGPGAMPLLSLGPAWGLSGPQ